MTKFAAIWIGISLGLWAAVAGAAPACEAIRFENTPFTICKADPTRDRIGLFLNDADGSPLGTFERLEARVREGSQTVVFAMNGGMYHPDRRPVGLYIEDGRQLAGLVTRAGPGNFGLLPNGVLCLRDGRADVIESLAFRAAGHKCRFATQSGPMLVIEGRLHPRFLADSASRYVRNGVGVASDGTLIAAISNRPVTFHTFGRLFRDVLKTPNALFLDGNVSRLYAPALDRHDAGFPMGPMLAVTKPLD